MPETETMSDEKQLKALRPNVGFMLREAAGYHRALDIDLPAKTILGGVHLRGLTGTLELTRTPQGSWLDGQLSAEMPAECARCLEPFSLKAILEFQEMFYSPPSKAASPSDYVVFEDGVMDLEGPIRERLVLNIPLRPLCRPDCRGLCSQCGQNMNQGDCDCQEDVIDPRMAGLAKLKEQLSE